MKKDEFFTFLNKLGGWNSEAGDGPKAASIFEGSVNERLLRCLNRHSICTFDDDQIRSRSKTIKEHKFPWRYMPTKGTKMNRIKYLNPK